MLLYCVGRKVSYGVVRFFINLSENGMQLGRWGGGGWLLSLGSTQEISKPCKLFSPTLHVYYPPLVAHSALVLLDARVVVHVVPVVVDR